MPSYDDIQLTCDLRRCPTCARMLWMHPSQTICVKCTDRAEKQKEILSRVDGEC